MASVSHLGAKQVTVAWSETAVADAIVRGSVPHAKCRAGTVWWRAAEGPASDQPAREQAQDAGRRRVPQFTHSRIVPARPSRGVAVPGLLPVMTLLLATRIEHGYTSPLHRTRGSAPRPEPFFRPGPGWPI